MTPLVTNMNWFLSSLVLASQVFLVIMLLLLLFLRKQGHPMIAFFSQHAYFFSFLVALTSTLGSLFYSEIAGFDPCKLCWFQRIFMYPQVILFAAALWRKQGNCTLASVWLSGIGAVIAGYHYLIQRNIIEGLPCSVVGYSEVCSKVFVINFDYITIPLMAFTGFLLILLFQYLSSYGHRAPVSP